MTHDTKRTKRTRPIGPKPIRFTLTIDCDNAAFDPCPYHEIARILRGLDYDFTIRGVEDVDGALIDANGNRVGSWELTGMEGGAL